MNRQKNVRREKQSKEYMESCLEKQILEDNTKDRDTLEKKTLDQFTCGSKKT